LSNDTTLRVAIYTTLFCSIATAVYVLAQLEPSPIVSLFLSLAPIVSVVLWLQKDALRTGVGAVQDWGMFVWFAWPVVIPWYAFKSRGRRGWRLLAGLLALILSPYITGLAVAWLAYLTAWRSNA
jgi:hypothetical protein